MSLIISRFAVSPVAALAVLTAGFAVLGPVPSAQAAAALPAGCLQTGGSVTCSYSPTAAEQQFAVPSGVTSVQVAAVGGAGQDFTGLGTAISGGLGARVSGNLPVTPGQILYVEVGSGGSGTEGGFNGGGSGTANGQGGGGASDLRTCSMTGDSCPGGGSSLDSRLLVAAGGGGAGGSGEAAGGAGGSAGTVPQPGATGLDSVTTFGGGGGGAASATAGGTGGTGGVDLSSASGSDGASGIQGTGGTGAHDLGAGDNDPGGLTGGGGGGGGWFGGGGAGSGSDHYIFAVQGFRIIPGAGGGGGAGSSYVDPSAEATSITTAGSAEAPSVTLTYTLPVPVLPGAPSIGAAMAGDGSATISFSAPTSDGNSPITGYVATATPDDGGTPVTATGSDEPFTLTGLANRTTYTVTIAAINGIGTGPASAPSNSFEPVAPLEITTPSPLPTFAVNDPISMVLNASGGTGLFTWSLFPGDSLPSGLTLGTDGTISGTPTTAVTDQHFSVRVADVQTLGQASIKLMIMTIDPAPSTVPGAPTIRSVTAGDGSATVGFTPPATDGGSAVTRYTVTSHPGSRTATGTGSPIRVTGLGNGTAYTFTVAATNSAGTGPSSSPSSPVTPRAQLRIATTSLPAGTVGARYTALLTATGGTGRYTWSLAPGSKLPGGISLQATGTITGSPTGAVTRTVTFIVRDAAAPPRTASRSLTLVVKPALHRGDLAVSNTHQGDFASGRTGSYRISVKNTGPGTTVGPITLTEALPRGLTSISASGPGWSCRSTATTVTCAHASALGASAASSVTVRVHITAPSGTTLATRASVTPTDSTPADNTSTDRVIVRRP